MGKKRKPATGRSDVAGGANATPVSRNYGVGPKPPKPPKPAARPKLIAPIRPDWHAHSLPSIQLPERPHPPQQLAIDKLKKHADKLLADENATAAATVFQSSSHKFMSTIMTSGTLEDKVSALTLAIQESPLHNTRALDNLVGLCRKKSRSHALMAVAAMKDLLGQGLVLPAERKLRFFGKQPAVIAALQNKPPQEKLPQGLTEAHLIQFAFEDHLKKSYFDFLHILEGWSNDEITFARNRAITYVWELLRDKPEQEENLLRLLVNKLGDTERKVASRASYLLLQLQASHPNMKETIIKSLEADVLFRPGQNSHAKYYAVVTLNQTVLSAKEPHLATKLLDIYFTLFRRLLHAESRPKTTRPKKRKTPAVKSPPAVEEELREKLIAQVLTGVNRAYPYVDPNNQTVQTQLDTIYEVSRSSNFSTCVQAMMLLQAISVYRHETADRYYEILYNALLDPRLIASSKQVLFLNLLYRSLKADLNVKRVKAFVKRIFQSLVLHEPAFACSAMFLISEVQKAVPGIAVMYSEPEMQDEEERFLDVPDGEEDRPVEVPVLRRRSAYNSREKCPRAANADGSCVWELLPFLVHYHPTVALFANRLLEGKAIVEKPDPDMHTQMHFLDRFVYKNAKAKPREARGASIMQPLAGTTSADLLIKERGVKPRLAPNDEKFLAKNPEEVAVDEVFFHRYFNQIGKRKKKQQRSDRIRHDESDSEAGEEDIWKALVNSRPEIEGEDDEGFSEVEEFMHDSEQDDESELEELMGSDEGMELNEKADMDMNSEMGELESEDGIIGSDIDEQGEESQSKGHERKKRKLKHLPTFASFEEYEKMIEDDDE